MESFGTAAAFRKSPILAISRALPAVLNEMLNRPASPTLPECWGIRDEPLAVLGGAWEGLSGEALGEADCRLLRALCKVSCASRIAS